MCKEPFQDGVSCVWTGASEVGREDLGISSDFSGPRQTYRVTYTSMTDIPVAVCAQCLAKERKSGLPSSIGLLAVGVFFTVLPFTGLIGGELRGICGPAAFFTFFFSLFFLVDVLRRLGGAKSPGFVEEVTKPLAAAKASELGLGTIFPPKK